MVFPAILGSMLLGTGKAIGSTVLQDIMGNALKQPDLNPGQINIPGMSTEMPSLEDIKGLLGSGIGTNNRPFSQNRRFG